MDWRCFAKDQMVSMDLDGMKRSTEVGIGFAVHYEWAGTSLELVGYTCQNIVRSVFRRVKNHIRTMIEKPRLRLEQEYRQTLDRRMACRFCCGVLAKRKTGRW